MPNPYPRELRVRAVRAYESRTEPYPVIAARFEIGPATLMRWVQRQRETGTVDPLAKGGGWVGIVKLRLTTVSDAQHGGFTTGLSPVSWGSID